MNRSRFRWWWLVPLVLMVIGLARLRFDAQVLDLLPSGVPAVEGLKLYEQHFASARELIITVRASNASAAVGRAQEFYGTNEFR